MCCFDETHNSVAVIQMYITIGDNMFLEFAQLIFSWLRGWLLIIS